MEIRARYVLIGLFALAIILGGFAFVFWLNHSGGVGPRVSFRVRFETPVSGLGLGSEVRFNGIRVGEVTELRLDPADPAAVVITIAVAADAPIRTDTKVGLAYGGLTGTAAVALTGGTSTAPPLRSSDGEPPVLTADPDAAVDWTTAARDAFKRVDGILSDNADSLHDVIGNIAAFAGALGRNSDKVDKIVAGLERMTGNAAAPPATIYDLKAVAKFGPGLSVPQQQLVVLTPTSVVSLDTQRFLVAADGRETLAFDDAKWSDSIPSLVREKLIQSFENAGYLQTAGDMQGLAADRQLLIDVRAFHVVAGAEPSAEVAFSGKVVGSDGKVIAGRIFRATAPVEKMDAPDAAAALNAAFASAATELVTWVMQTP